MYLGRWGEDNYSRLLLFSCSVLSDTLRPHRLQHARLSCLSPSPEAYSNSCPLKQWCHPASSSSVVPYSSCHQHFSASGSFPMSQLFESGGQSFGASTLASVLPMNIQDRLPLESPCSPRDSQASSPALQFESINSLALSLFYCPALTSIHDWKNRGFDYTDGSR